ncbi:MAG: four helix bundle protein [Gemmatimonadota bacterium]
MEAPDWWWRLLSMGREKLRVEIKAEELIAEIARVLRKIRYPCHASKHLENSGNSLYFNLGEGVAAFKPKVKAAKYDITRGEANEVMKAARALVLQGRLTESDVEKIDDLADYTIDAMTNMIKRLEGRM